MNATPPLLLLLLACGSAKPTPGRAQAHDASLSPPSQGDAAPDKPTASEPAKPEVWQRGPGVDVVRSTNSTTNTHGVGAPSLFHATVGLYVRDGASHTIEVNHLALVVDACGPPRRDDALGAREIVRKREPLAIRRVRMFDTMGDVVLATGNPLALPTRGLAAYELDLDFDTKRLGETCGQLAFAVELTIDRDHFEVSLPIGIPHDLPLPHGI